MGNRFGARPGEFAWTLGNRRRLARYLQAELTYAEAALLLGTTRGSVAAQASKQKIDRLTPEERRDRSQRSAYEGAVHGRRAQGRNDDWRYVEPWSEYSARRKRERAEARA